MGPGSFDPGNERNRAIGVPATIASMGPGSFDPGNAHMGLPDGFNGERLQWGRGLLTPEMFSLETLRPQEHIASMGPGSFDPGNASNSQR